MTLDALWQDIEAKIARYNSLCLSEVVDHKKLYLYSLITHSTAIEGSTLTELDTQLLFDDGITAKGKPLVHHLMNEDLKNAYLWVMENAIKNTPVTVAFLQEANARIMKTTGTMMYVAAGSFDSSKGDFRLCNVQAGFGGESYLNFSKVPEKTAKLACTVQSSLDSSKHVPDIYNMSFDAHLNLVTIHPWVDGNGRTARLLMNYLQLYHSLILSKVYREDKAEYITALMVSRQKNDREPFRTFMAEQLLKMLDEETQKGYVKP
ncbi:cell filamentation protein Fic [Spirochaetia bacterium]|nr:cell filamentation protein Fic [Spirochaetia bacterium]